MVYACPLVRVPVDVHHTRTLPMLLRCQPAWYHMINVMLCKHQVHSSTAPTHLVIIAGMLLRSTILVNSRTAEYVGYLAKGQLPPARISLTRFEEDMVLEGAYACMASCDTLLPSMAAAVTHGGCLE